MADFDPIDINFLINKNEVRRDAEQVKRDIRGVAVEAEAVEAKVNKQTSGLIYGDEAAKKEAQRIADLQNHYAELQKKIQANSAKRNAKLLPEADEVEKTTDAIGDAADEVAKLGTETEKTAEKQDKSRKSTSGMIDSLVGWTAILYLGLEALRAYGPEIFDYIKGMFGLKRATEDAALAQENLNKAFDSSEYKKGIANIIELRNTLELAKQGFVDQSVAIEQYNEIIGDTAGKAKNLTDVEQGLIDNADAYIEMTFKKAAANLALEEAAQKAVEAEKRRNNLELSDLSVAEQVGLAGNAPGAGGLLASLIGSPIDIAEAQKRADAAAEVLEKEGESLTDIYEKLINEAETAAKKLKTSVFGDGGKDAKKIFEQRKKLLEQIAELDREYNRKQLTTNEAEVQAIKDKFDRVRKIVKEFNADPKNSKARISIDALDEIEGRATADLIYKQETRALKAEIEEQKKIYEEFEDYKATFGNEAARERYAEQLSDFESFAESLKDIKDRNKEAFEAVNSDTATGGEVERVKLISKSLNEETAKQLKAFQEQLGNLQSYNQERALAIEKFEELKQRLIEEGRDAELAVAEEKHQEELDALDDANIKKTRAYKELFEATGRLTIATANKLIANAKKLLETQNLSAEVRAKILKTIAETEDELNDLKSDELFRVADSIGRLGQSLVELGDSDLAETGRALTGIANGLKDVINIDNSETNGAKISQGINSLIGLITTIAVAAKKRKEAEEDYYNSVLGFQYDYNLALQDQIRIQQELGENVFLEDYEGRIVSALEAVKQANAGYKEALADLSEATAITGQRNKIDFGAVGAAAGSGAGVGAAIGSVVPVIGTAIGAVVGAVVGGIIGLFAGKKKAPEYTAILQEYPELLKQGENGVIKLNDELAKSLIANDLVNKKTKQILENIIGWGEKLEEARAQIKEVVGELAGNLGSDIRDDLIEAFRAGEDAAIRMGDTIEGVLENIVGQLLFNQIFDGAFDQLEKDLQASFDPLSGDGNFADELAKFFNQAEGLTDDFNKALTDAQNEASGFGFDIFEPEDSAQDRGLAGAIRRELTEETGSELTGLFRNQLDTTKGHFELAQKSFDLDQRNYDATLNIMRDTALIEENTRGTVIELTKVVGRLDDIKNNTKKDQSARDLGFTG